MAKYLILIYGDEQQWDAMSPHEERELGEAHRAFQTAAGSAVVDVQQLEPSSMATALEQPILISEIRTGLRSLRLPA
jgi:hypothetical protein